MNILAVIPQRGGSRGVPRKNTLTIAGRPILAYTLDFISRSAYHPIRTIVTTEDDEIASIAKGLGVEVIPRDASLQGPENIAIEAVRDVMFAVEEQGYAPDLILELYACNPVRPDGSLDQCLDLIAGNELITSVTTIIPAWPYHPQFLLTMDSDQFLSYLPGNVVNRQHLAPYYYAVGTTVVYRRQYLAIQEPGNPRASYGPRPAGIVIASAEFIDIDTPADLARAEVHLMWRKHKESFRDTEALARELHEARRQAAASIAARYHDEQDYKNFSWQELPEPARENLREQARYLADRIGVSQNLNKPNMHRETVCDRAAR